MATLRRTAAPEKLRELWTAARSADRQGGAACPSCRKPMAEVAISVDGEPALLDACRSCYFVWFDGAEFADFRRNPHVANSADDEERASAPRARPSDPRKRLDPQAARALATFELEHERRMRGLYAATRPIELSWRSLPALLGLPVEIESPGYTAYPWVTWLLVGLVGIVSALAMPDLDAVVAAWGFLPAEPLRHHGATFLTSFFLHAGWLHLLFNLYWLLVFGDDVEGFAKRTAYVCLIALSTALGCACHALVTESANVPVVGASAGISGVIAYYAMVFPRARIGLVVGSRWAGHAINVSARTALVLWIVLQLFGAALQTIAHREGISYSAHLGGAAVGLVIGFLARSRDRARDVADPESLVPAEPARRDTHG